MTSAELKGSYTLSVKCTDKIKSELDNFCRLPHLSKDLHDKLTKYKDSETIPFCLLREAQKYCKDVKGIYLHELLMDSEPILPSYEPPPRNPELEARIQRLKHEQMNREYERMTKNVICGQPHENYKTFGDEIKSVQKMMITIFNFILTVVGSFAFAYKATEYSLHTPNVALQLCAGLIVGTVVFFADLYFVMKHELVEEGTVSVSVYDKKLD